MYASIDFATKKAFRLAVKAGMPIVCYSPALGMPAINGKETVEGPWPKMSFTFQAADAPVFGPQLPVRKHKIRGWTARVEVKDMYIVAVH